MPTSLITGGTGGLGKAISRAFLERGDDVIITYFSDAELKDLLEFVGDKKSHLDAVRVDVTDEASLEALVDHLRKNKRTVDNLVCLVGGFATGTVGEGIGEIFDRQMTLNAKAFLLTCNAILPLMKSRKPVAWRHIVGVAARPALEPSKGIGVYAASKAAVVSLVKTLALELLTDNITVNAIAPSTIDTAANRKAMPRADVKSWIKPEQLAQTILYLCSQAGDPTSGTVVPVYGKA